MTQQPERARRAVSVHDSIADIGATDWNAVAGTDFPFLRFEFLHAAEASGSASTDTGWQPSHITVRDSAGRFRGALPLYEKTHSWGEFVFDWAWANAYSQAGFDYYPKLVSAVPFTPASSPRLLLRDKSDSGSARALIDAAIALARERQCSSLHVQFPLGDETTLLADAGLKLRKDCQFHWHNRGYRNFDEFLQTFSSAKRKKARRDRRHVAEAGVRFRRLSGRELSESDIDTMYGLISRTFMRRGSLPYFTRDFFSMIAESLPDELLVLFADDDAGPVATAVFIVGSDALYGRYWGAAARYNALHFETCYYQGIEYCIERGIDRFEPGTQGEHKVSRGFLPSETWSAHWLAQPEFFSAVGRYVEEEAEHIDRYMDAIDRHSPFRREEP